ncbi:MAG TPA: S41 family peptidase [Actinocatenispora sp.]
MDQSEIARVVDDMRTLITTRYVHPEDGVRIGELIGTRAAAGRYADAADPADLAARVTADAQELNGDLHLRLIAHDEPLPEPTDTTTEAGEAAIEAAFAARAERTMGGIARVERLDDGVGLLAIEPTLWQTTLVGDAIAAAMTILARTRALVLDLRGCVGGDPGTVALVCSYLLPPETHLNDIVNRIPGGGEQTIQFWTLPYVPGPRYGTERPVAVLTSGRTFSGGEELAYDLQQAGRATLVGETTRGGAHPRIGVPVHPHLEASIPVARSLHPVTGTNWEGVGVSPDIAVPADDALAAALTHLAGLARPA